jgi:uncharacterized membrane protein YgdD (TMEM256/DUF423 family)
MDRLFICLGSLSAFIGVALGAFGAHALKTRLSVEALGTFEIGVRYQMYHALALVAVGIIYARWPSALASAAGGLFLAGTLLFCGSLYALALTGARWLGAIAPLGGMALLAGWVCLARAGWKV